MWFDKLPGLKKEFDRLREQRKNKKIRIIHVSAVPFHSNISNYFGNRYSFNFIGTNCKNHSDVKNRLATEIKNMSGNSKITILKEIPFPIYSGGVCPGIILQYLRNNYDIVWVNGLENINSILGFAFAKILRKKIYIEMENWFWPKTIPGKIIKPLSRFMCRHCDGMIISGGSKQVEFIKNLGAKKIFSGYRHILYSPYSIQKLTSKKLIKKKNSSKRFDILYIGRIVKYKGLNFLIKTFIEFNKKYPNSKLHIVGPVKSAQYDGKNTNYYNTCLQLASNNLPKKAYNFYGNKNSVEVKKFYKMCDVVVMPNYLTIDEKVPVESWGFVCIETVQNFKPIIASDCVASAYDVIKQGINGYRYHYSDEKQLFKSLELVMTGKKDKDFLKQLDQTTGIIDI